MAKIKNNKGMTLVEMLVAIVIFSTVVAITYSVYMGNMKFINKENIKTQLQNEAQVIDSTFLQLSMQSEGVVYPEITNAREYEEVDILVLEYQGKYIKWLIDENNLKLQVISDYDKEEAVIESEHQISQNIKYFAVKSVDEDNLVNSKIINVKIELAKQKGFSKVEYPLSVVVTFRNKN